MTIDVFVLQIMISGEIQAVNIGNTRLVPGFPQGSNSLEKASAQARIFFEFLLPLLHINFGFTTSLKRSSTW